MLGDIVGLFSSSGIGALLGVAGAFLTKREERKSAKDKYAHEEAMADLSMQELKLEGDQKIHLAETEGVIAMDVASAAAFKDGLKEQTKNYGILFVDGVRGLMRPFITVFLLGVATILTFKIFKLEGGLGSLSPNELSDLFKTTLNQIMFLATTSVTWWFGSRPASQRKA